jgi:hypothetical protein
LDATGDRRTFYETELGVWSNELHVALDQLETIDSARDARLAADDRHEREAEEASDTPAAKDTAAA